MKKLIIFFGIFMAGIFSASAQKILDEVVAQVGNEMILLSDVEGQVLQYKDLTKDKQGVARCVILDQLMQKKLLLSRAKIDSLKVSDEQVENELNRRMQYFIQTYGSEEKIESFYHKPILEIKNDFRTPVKEQLLEEQMQNKVVADAEPTPEEIQKYYNAISKDSLPYYNTEFEIGQIVLFPKPSREDVQGTTDKLQQIRKKIMSGKLSFSAAAILYSEDGSSRQGGDLGWQRADNYVPEFAAAALGLSKDSISDIVTTKFGVHIIQMIERKGDMIHVRHILLHISPGEKSIERNSFVLDSVRTAISKNPKKDSLFTALGYSMSQDDETKNRGGMLIDPKTSSSHIPVDQLDAVTFDAIDKLKPGEISEPKFYRSPDGKDGYRILYLKSKNAPHKANLKDDYPKIKQMAQEDKKAQRLNIWFVKYIPQTFIRINPAYDNCKNLVKWHKGATSALGN
jgi:peptidyl-prolyl cis-trans isomerase SurA